MNTSICFIAGGLSGGGQERALTYLANEFASRGNKISIICLFKTEIFFELQPNIQVIWPSLDRNITNKFVYALRLVPYIRKNVKKINPDSIISFGDWFNAYSIVATRFLNKPTYITNRMGPNLYLGKFIEFFNKHTYKYATSLIVQTARAKEIMQHKYKIKTIHVIPNAIKPVIIENRLPEKSIITIGRLSKEKGHKVLIEAFSNLKDKTWRLDIVGDGPEMNNLKQLVTQLNLQSNVYFHGHQKDFKHLLAKASLFVLPSFYEGFPNALVEAMTVPLTCIASDCVAGPSEIITHGENGFLFETGNSEALTQILDYIIGDTLRMNDIADKAKSVMVDYDFQNIATNFITIVTSKT
jgi:GalNAc-alpha-(1->4)-GalNAc-alpha-(1->3)-diNAcBac-PP-undecaprenol alpha-1,4-N-acetyl-D-galactosaminyltransferase